MDLKKIIEAIKIRKLLCYVPENYKIIITKSKELKPLYITLHFVYSLVTFSQNFSYFLWLGYMRQHENATSKAKILKATKNFCFGTLHSIIYSYLLRNPAMFLIEEIITNKTNVEHRNDCQHKIKRKLFPILMLKKDFAKQNIVVPVN
jgi:hypothetical protein